MSDLFQRRVFRQFIKYLGTGGVAAVVNFGSRFFYGFLYSYSMSVVLAYASGMFVNFGLSKVLVFEKKESQDTPREFIRFFLVSLIGLAITVASSNFIVFVINGSAEQSVIYAIGHILGIGFAFVWNFFMHKFFSFKDMKM